MSAALGGAGGGGGFLPPRRPSSRRNGPSSSSSSSSLSRGQLVRRAASAAAASSSYFERVKGWSGPLKAAVTSGSLCAVGDVLAQSIAGWYASRDAAAAADPKAKKAKKGASASSSSAPAAPYDACRTLRMAGFGLLFYGPYQYYWYSLLEHLMPQRTVSNFVSKVAANQLLLAPVTLTVAFAWHLAFSSPAAAAKAAAPPAKNNGKNKKSSAAPPPKTSSPLGALAHRLSPLPDKLRADFVPALLTGWKFWVPAASVNFCAVPLRHQVLYMSCCGVLWTAYLSHASGNKISGGGEGKAGKDSNTKRR